MYEFKRKFSFALIINLFFAFTLIVYGPYEIFISNSSDFDFTFLNFWWMPCVVAGFYIIITSSVISCLPEKLCSTLLTLIFSFTLCCYLQAMFFNGKMKVLIGEQISWDAKTILINLFAWFVIFVSIFIIKFIFKKYWKKIFSFVSCSLIIMQLVALFSLLATTDILKEEKNGYISTEGMFDLSSNDNVIVFILDFFDGKTMDAILEKYPDTLSSFDSFTYFPNATSVHSRTYPSIPYLLTGIPCHFDLKPEKYVNNAFNNSNFLSTLSSNGINIGLYTFDEYIGNSAKSKICNFIPADLSLKFVPTIKYLAKIILYRDMPYLCKARFTYDATDINNNVTSNSRQNEGIQKVQAKNPVSAYRNFDDEWFNNMINETTWKLTDNNGAFRFYHLGSCHLDLNNREFYGQRSLEIVYNYLEHLKDLGIYDSSTIIITADHGSSGGGKTLDLPQQTAVPLLIVKPAEITSETIKISNAPVSHTDIIPTVLNGFSLDYTDYGKTVFDISEKENRNRYYYYSALYTNEEGEVELREYKISGDARDPQNYKFTNNKWKILYSYNIVAKE